MYERLRKEEEGNLFFAPYGIAEAMGMVFAGARGETAAEISIVLHFDQPQSELHKAFQSLRNTTAGNFKGADYELKVANRLWGQTGFPFRETYRELTRTRYGAEIQPVKFSQPAAVAE